MGIRGGIKGRLRSLEKKSRLALRCRECGFAPDVPGRSVIVGEGFGEVDEYDPEERCDHCGRRLWFVIEVVYDPPADSEGGGGYCWP